jgi:hypothetical protein
MSPKLPTALASITLSLGLFLAVATAGSSKAPAAIKASASVPAAAPAAAPAGSPAGAPALSDTAAITPETVVYLGTSGSRYHVKGCTYLKKKGKSISIMDAMKQGYAPCNVCKAPKLKR